MSLRSMTGFGGAAVEIGTAPATQRFRIQVRTVNHRFLDVRFKTGRDMVALEAALTRLVKERVERGHVDVLIEPEPGAPAASEVRIDQKLAGELAWALGHLSTDLPYGSEKFARFDLGAVLAFPGVVTVVHPEVRPEEHSGAFEDGMRAALAALTAMRDEEGLRLEADLQQRLGTLKGLTADLRREAPRLAAGYRARLTRRIDELLGPQNPLDPGRLEQEVALMAERSDVSEEVTRLASHLDQFEGELTRTSCGSGKKLEFITQELLRELNTIGSKIGDADLIRLVIEGKSEIEKIREQVANLE